MKVALIVLGIVVAFGLASELEYQDQQRNSQARHKNCIRLMGPSTDQEIIDTINWCSEVSGYELKEEIE